jgi:hypothetical protein
MIREATDCVKERKLGEINDGHLVLRSCKAIRLRERKVRFFIRGQNSRRLTERVL